MTEGGNYHDPEPEWSDDEEWEWCDDCDQWIHDHDCLWCCKSLESHFHLSRDASCEDAEDAE